MRQFKDSNLTPEEIKFRYIELTLKSKYSSESLTMLNEFVDRLAMKFDIRGTNLELLFVAYMCYINLGFGAICERMIRDNVDIPSPGFVSETLKWLDGQRNVRKWHSLYSAKKSYTYDKFKLDIVMYIITVINKINSTELNVAISDSEDGSSSSSSEEKFYL